MRTLLLLILAVGLIAALLSPIFAKRFLKMPGVSGNVFSRPLGAEEELLRARLKEHVLWVGGKIGERHVWRYEKLREAAEYIEGQLSSYGYTPVRQEYTSEQQKVWNIEVEIPGSSKPDEIIIIGAHYDSVRGSPAANDNGSGVSAMLALAEQFSKIKPERTLRFVAFVNEELPFFFSGEMGSMLYAKRSRKKGENIVGMISLETMGYYSEEEQSQRYPFPLNLYYPSAGSFVGFVGNSASSDFVRRVVRTFRKRCDFPSEGAALPRIFKDAGRSDQASFWWYDYPGIMVTDTANFRYQHYHQASDTPEKLNYDAFARVVYGLGDVIKDLVNEN